MQISLFSCNAEKNRVNKLAYLVNRMPINGTLRSETSAMNVSIIVEKSNPLEYKYNYMYIGDFNRYYFIDEIRSIRNGLWEINGTCDVLFSFSNDILNSYAVIDKEEKEDLANLYLDDGSFIMEARKYNEVLPFSSGFNDSGQYILICAGGS